MVRSSIALAALPAVVLALTACGSAAPAHSAPAACRDFRKWFLAENGNVASGRNASLLETAVSEAPSGKLYRDLSTLKSNVSTTSAAQGNGLRAAEKLMTLESAQAVEQDCEAANPG